MVKFKTSTLSKKEKSKISYMLDELNDIYQEFYITKNNIRLSIKENKNLLYNCLKKGDKIVYNNKGIIFITGFSDKAKRYYIKILTEKVKDVNNLIKVLLWNLKTDLWIKINKKNMEQLDILKKYGFRFIGNRGRELLFKREGDSRR